MDELLALFVEEERKPLNSKIAHRQGLAKLVQDHGRDVVVKAWKLYLKKRDTKLSWPAQDFVANFASWRTLAVATVERDEARDKAEHDAAKEAYLERYRQLEASKPPRVEEPGPEAL